MNWRLTPLLKLRKKEKLSLGLKRDGKSLWSFWRWKEKKSPIAQTSKARVLIYTYGYEHRSEIYIVQIKVYGVFWSDTYMTTSKVLALQYKRMIENGRIEDINN